MKTTIAIYTRTNQGQASSSLDVQLARCTEYAKERFGEGITIAHYSDSGIGAVAHKPGLHQLRLAVMQGEVSAVIVTELTRLGRARNALETDVQLFVDNKVEFHSLGSSIKLDGPQAELMLGIWTAIAKYESETRSQRMRETAGSERVVI